MKRILVTLFAALFTLVAFVPAYAQGVTKLRTVPLEWHTTLDPSLYASAAVAYAKGDSYTVYRGTGIRNSAQQVDTTQSIDIRQFVMPGPTYSTQVASDTIAWLRLSLFPIGTVPTIAADSIICAVQVSDDNVTWNATLFAGPQASTGTTPTSCIILETGGSSNCFQYVIRQVLGGVTRSIFSPALVATVPQQSTYGFKYMRFLLTGDYTGQYDAEATGFVPLSTGATSP